MGKNLPFRHIEEEYRVSASPLTLPLKGRVGGPALHPSLEGRPFVLRFFLLAAASRSVPTQPVATPP